MKVIQPVLKVTGLIAIVLLALLVYTFVPAKLDVGATRRPHRRQRAGSPIRRNYPRSHLQLSRPARCPRDHKSAEVRRVAWSCSASN